MRQGGCPLRPPACPCPGGAAAVLIPTAPPRVDLLGSIFDPVLYRVTYGLEADWGLWRRRVVFYFSQVLVMPIFVILDCKSCGACIRSWPPRGPDPTCFLGVRLNSPSHGVGEPLDLGTYGVPYEQACDILPDSPPLPKDVLERSGVVVDGILLPYVPAAVHHALPYGARGLRGGDPQVPDIALGFFQEDFDSLAYNPTDVSLPTVPGDVISFNGLVEAVTAEGYSEQLSLHVVHWDRSEALRPVDDASCLLLLGPMAADVALPGDARRILAVPKPLSHFDVVHSGNAPRARSAATSKAARRRKLRLRGDDCVDVHTHTVGFEGPPASHGFPGCDGDAGGTCPQERGDAAAPHCHGWASGSAAASEPLGALVSQGPSQPSCLQFHCSWSDGGSTP